MTRTFVRGDGELRSCVSFGHSREPVPVPGQSCVARDAALLFFPFLSLSLSPPLGIYFCDYPDCLRTLLLFHSFGFGFSFVIAHRQGKREEGRGERTVNRTKDESENKTKYFSKDLGNERGREKGRVCWDSK